MRMLRPADAERTAELLAHQAAGRLQQGQYIQYYTVQKLTNSPVLPAVRRQCVTGCLELRLKSRAL
jgi:hypothetical protein